MNCRKYTITTLSCVGIALLIFDSKTAIAGAIDGIQLCLTALIPSLFPFCILTSILAKSSDGRRIPALKGIGKFCGIPFGLENIFITGCISGYPVGAKMIGDAYKNNQISQKDAQHMMGFCNNAGPAFLFGIIAPQFESLLYPWLIWIIHIISAILTGHVLNNHRDLANPTPTSNSITATDVIVSGIRSMAIISGWVILFRIIIFWLQRWIFWLPQEAQTILFGVLELTNGMVNLHHITDVSLRFILCSAMLSCGGLCVLMQTASVVSPMGIGKYIKGKALQTAHSLLFSIGILIHPLCIVIVFIGVCLIHKLIIRKSTRFSIENTV